MLTLARVALLAVTLVISALASAQGFPSRPIRMIVPYAPGGNVDISARIVGPGMGDLLGQTIIVENRPGGGGNVGAGLVAKATPARRRPQVVETAPKRKKEGTSGQMCWSNDRRNMAVVPCGDAGSSGQRAY